MPCPACRDMNKEALMRIRSMQAADLPAVMSIWNECVTSREVLYYPLTEAYFYKKFLSMQLKHHYRMKRNICWQVHIEKTLLCHIIYIVSGLL